MTGAIHLRGVLLPDGRDTVDLWLSDGSLGYEPVPGSEDLTALGAFLLPGLVDAHTHLTLDTGNTGNAPGSKEVVAGNLDIHLRAGELSLRDAGGITLAAHSFRGKADRPGLQAAAGFIAPEGGYMASGEWTAPDELAETARRHAEGGAD